MTVRPVQTRSRSGSSPEGISLAIPDQLVGSLCKRHAVASQLQPLVDGRFSLPCPGCFPPFPHGTGPLSVFRSYLALRDGPRGFRQDSSCPALLRSRHPESPLARTGMSPSLSGLSRPFRFMMILPCAGPTTPAGPRPDRFGLLPFRSPLLWESMFLSIPPGTEMFQFPGFAHLSV